MSPETEDSSSLHFLSTQIQSRYDDDIENERKASMLQKFKHPTPTFEPPPEKKARKLKRNPKSSKKSTSNGKKSSSLSAFVRETLGNRTKGDSRSILDFFSGDKHKAEDFLGRIEAATAIPHPLSKRGSSSLFSESEWRIFLDSVKLKFPNLSKTNHKTLKMLTRRIHEMRQRENADNAENSQDLDMWSQASRQPSDQLSAEDMKWLYDLDDDQVVNDISEVVEGEEDGKSFFVTLSQVLDEERDEENEEDEERYGYDEEIYEDNKERYEYNKERYEYSESRILPGQLVLVPDSESEPEELDPEEFFRLELSQSFRREKVEVEEQIHIEEIDEGKIQVLSLSQLSPPEKSAPTPTQIPSHQVPESLDILTSISFGSICKNESKMGRDTEVMSSIPKLAEFKTPQQWANNLAITSSPPSKNESPTNQKSQVDSQFLSPVKYSPEEFSTAPTGLEENACELQAKSSVEIIEFATPTRNRSSSSHKSVNYLNSGSPQRPELELLPRLISNAPIKSHLRSPTQDSGFSVHISPIKRKSYVTSIVEVYGKVELQTQTSKMRISTLPEVSLDDIIPDSEEDEGEVSIIEISREVPNLDRQRSVLQVPSSP